MIVFGGRSDEAGPIHSAQELYDDTIYMFDTRNNRWSVPKVTGPLPVGRRSHCACKCCIGQYWWAVLMAVGGRAMGKV